MTKLDEIKVGDTVRKRKQIEFKPEKELELEYDPFLKMMIPKNKSIVDFELILVTPDNIEELKNNPEVY